MNIRFHQIFLTPLLSLFLQPAFAEIPAIEREALIALYNSTSGSQWHNNSGWQAATVDVCSWFGVSCDVSQGFVTELQLDANNLKGPLPESLVNLSQLSLISINYNGVYSDSQSVNDFVQSKSELNYQNSQTLDARGVSFDVVGSNSLQLSWDTAGYLDNDGGYRVYLAQQIDSESGSVTTEFIKQGDDIVGKNNLTSTLSDLQTCRQYFVKIISYTDAHPANSHAIESDGLNAPIMGTITGLDESCQIIGSPYNDSFSVDQNSSSAVSAIIEVSANGERHYQLSGSLVFNIDGGAGDDSLTVIGEQDNTWIITDNNSGDVNGDLFSSIEHLIGGAGTDNFNLLDGVSLDSSINGNIVNITGEMDVIINGDVTAESISVVAVNSVELGSSLNVIGELLVTTENITSSNSCESVSSSVTLSGGDYTVVSVDCPITVVSIPLGEAPILLPYSLYADVELSTVEITPLSQEDLLQLDGFEFPTDDGNTCILSQGQCIAEDGSVYVLNDDGSKLVKENAGNGSLGFLSLFLFMIYSCLRFNRRAI